MSDSLPIPHVFTVTLSSAQLSQLLWQKFSDRSAPPWLNLNISAEWDTQHHWGVLGNAESKFFSLQRPRKGFHPAQGTAWAPGGSTGLLCQGRASHLSPCSFLQPPPHSPSSFPVLLQEPAQVLHSKVLIYGINKTSPKQKNQVWCLQRMCN